MMVDPKSGCCISRKAMAPVSAADKVNTGSERSPSLRLRSQAMATTKNGFKNSDGWS